MELSSDDRCGHQSLESSKQVPKLRHLRTAHRSKTALRHSASPVPPTSPNCGEIGKWRQPTTKAHFGACIRQATRVEVKRLSTRFSATRACAVFVSLPRGGHVLQTF